MYSLITDMALTQKLIKYKKILSITFDILLFACSRNVMIAGGMESLSNSPFLLERGSTPYGGINLKDSCSFDALTDAYSGWHMGK